METATFGAGCFWGIEQAFAQLAGVTKTTVGYEGGYVAKPTYEDVCTDSTGHAEVVQIEFNPDIISFCELLKVFFSIHDPTTIDRQGPDVGSQYRSVIFYHSEGQKSEAQRAKNKLEEAKLFKHPVVTEIRESKIFYDAEEYHQKYLEKNGMAHCAVDATKVLDIDFE